MAKKNDQFQGALENALAQVSRDIMIRAIANMPHEMSLGEFIDAMDSTSFAAEFRALDLAGLHAALSQRAPKAPRGRLARATNSAVEAFSTRSESGRAAIDEAISDCLKSAGGPLRSEAIKAATSATPAQIRQSLARLMEAGQVVKKGEKRATEYRWNGRR